jgi:SET domain-containing protein 6
LESGGDIPEDLVGCAKILVMPIEEFKTTVLKEKKIPSTKLNAQIQKILKELLEEKLAEYPSSAKVR